MSVLPSAKSLTLTTTMTAACAVAGAIATSRGTRADWYEKLDKPPFQPPAEVFPIAWTALYADIAVFSAKTLDELDPAERRAFCRALAVNLGLNAAWCWTFFASGKLHLSVAVAAALAVSSADLARRAGRAKKRYGAAMSLYAAWCEFAAVLTGSIADRNPHGGLTGASAA